MDASDSFLGEIGLWPGGFVPKDWAECNGQLLQIKQNSALFSLLGTTYGGDGRTTFALPDLRGRVPVGANAAGGYAMGGAGGQESVTLLASNLPSHSHQIWGTDALADSEPPQDALPAKVNGTHNKYFAGKPDVAIADNSFGEAGKDQPHENRQPWLAMTYVIALKGVFPHS